MAIYGAIHISSPFNEENVEYDYLGTNSAALTAGDPLTVTSNHLLVAGNSDPVVGIAVKTQTLTSSNVGTANVSPGYIPIGQNDLFLMGCNTALTSTAANAGSYCKLTANTTATVQVDTSNTARTGADRVVQIMKVDPFNEGGATNGLLKVIVRFVKTPYTNLEITS